YSVEHIVLTDEHNNYTEKRTDIRNNPIAHSNLWFSPPLCFKVMVKWGHDKEFPFKNLFPDKLKDNRTGCHHKRKRDNRQVHNSIRKKRNNGQRQRKCHDACFCHHKCRRWDIKPQECKNTSNNHKAERGDVNLILIKGDEPICSKN